MVFSTDWLLTQGTVGADIVLARDAVLRTRGREPLATKDAVAVLQVIALAAAFLTVVSPQEQLRAVALLDENLDWIVGPEGPH